MDLSNYFLSTQLIANLLYFCSTYVPPLPIVAKITFIKNIGKKNICQLESHVSITN